MKDHRISDYKPGQAAIKLVSETPIVLLVGISGAGKDSIKRILLQTGNYHHIVSHTTRKPRVNGGVLEQDGVDYHFITVAEALNMADEGGFVEVKQYGDNIYGTSVAEIQAASNEHKIAVTDLEVQGVAEYKAISTNVIALFILPPDYEEWQRRLYARYGTHKADAADIAKRMQTAILELEEALQRPYYHFIVNNDLHTAVATADKIAHGDDSFNRIDTKVRHQAEALLASLRQATATQ
jgi:guanylate kinase